MMKTMRSSIEMSDCCVRYGNGVYGNRHYL